MSAVRPKHEWVARHRLEVEAWVRDVQGIPEKARKQLLRELRGMPTAPAPTRGRPKVSLSRTAAIDALRAGGGSVRAAAAHLGIPRTTLGRVLDREGIPTHVSEYPEDLKAEHVELLLGSAITPAVARARGYHCSRRGMRIPLWTASGEQAWVQTRYDKPLHPGARYGNPSPCHPVVDVNPAGRDLVLDRARPLYVAESPRGADAALSAGLASVAMQGARMICTDAAQWRAVGIRGRTVRVAFDADAQSNPEVAMAETTLCERLSALGGKVTVIRLPPLERHPKAGLDDFIAERGAAELLRLA